MSTYTTNYNLIKYEKGYPDWDVGMNNNLDIIDSELKMLDGRVLTTLEKTKFDELVGGGDTTLHGHAGILTRGYGQAWRASNYKSAVAGTWYMLDLDDGNANLLNVTHSILTNPSRVTVTNAGIYRVWVRIEAHDGATAHEEYLGIAINGTVQDASIVCGRPSAVAGQAIPFETEIIVSLTAGQYVSLAVATSAAVANYDVSVPTTSGTAPSGNFKSASLVIERIG